MTVENEELRDLVSLHSRRICSYCENFLILDFNKDMFLKHLIEEHRTVLSEKERNYIKKRMKNKGVEINE